MVMVFTYIIGEAGEFLLLLIFLNYMYIYKVINDGIYNSQLKDTLK